MASGGQDWGLQAMSWVLGLVGMDTCAWDAGTVQSGVAGSRVYSGSKTLNVQVEQIGCKVRGGRETDADQSETSFWSAQKSPKHALGSSSHTIPG